MGPRVINLGRSKCSYSNSDWIRSVEAAYLPAEGS